MLKYGDLDLTAIKEKCGLDFAHFTYLRGQCSCCYGPKDLPKRYWKDQTIPDHDEYSYVLFKNANNGSGTVTKNYFIKNYTCISYRFFSTDQKEMFCRLLVQQLDSDYVVAVPKDEKHCIIIFTKESLENHMSEIDTRFYYVLGNEKKQEDKENGNL